MRTILALILAALLAGCAGGGYTVREVHDPYAAADAPRQLATHRNEIDTHDFTRSTITPTLNAFVLRDPQTGKVVSTGFEFIRVASTSSVGWTGEPQWINIRRGDRAVFVADGERIVLQAASGSTDHDIATVGVGIGRRVEGFYYDYARYLATPEQYWQIASAASLSFRITGRGGHIDYPRAGQPLKTFQPNLRRFYAEQVEPYL